METGFDCAEDNKNFETKQMSMIIYKNKDSLKSEEGKYNVAFLGSYKLVDGNFNKSSKISDDIDQFSRLCSSVPLSNVYRNIKNGLVILI